jgi:hypothetical protein
MDTPAEPTPADRKKIAALLIVYLAALQNGPGLPDGQWNAAEEMKERLSQELA